MLSVRDLIVEVRDKNLNRLGQIPLGDLNMTISDQFNNVGTWTITIRPDHPMAGFLSTPGAGIVIVDSDGNAFASGPVTESSIKQTVQDPHGTMTVNGVTDTVLLADRLCFPDPSNPDPVGSNAAAAYDVRTDTAEGLMYQFVSANIGPNAPSERRDTRLVMGNNLGRGAVQTKSVRFTVLGNTCAELAITASLGFRVIQVGANLVFQTYAGQDRRSYVRMDTRNNQLSGSTVSQAPPTVTRAIVAGQGDLTNRQFVERTSTDSLNAETQWGRRIEQFIDQRQTSDTSQLDAAGDKAIANGGFAQLSVQVVPMENMALQYGTDWNMGDIVTVVVDGVELSSMVTGYVLKNDSNGFQFGAVLGDATFNSTMEARLVKLSNRVNQLEVTTPTVATTDNGPGGTAATLQIWTSAGYVTANTAHPYLGPADPASFGLSVPDGTVWNEVSL